MDRQAFNLSIETQLAPTLAPDAVVILDNLSVHKSAKAEAAVQAKGAWMLCLPQYSPDLNPIDPSARSGGLLKAQGPPAKSQSANHRGPCGRPSVQSANSTRQMNAGTTSKKQAMLQIKHTML